MFGQIPDWRQYIIIIMIAYDRIFNLCKDFYNEIYYTYNIQCIIIIYNDVYV